MKALDARDTLLQMATFGKAGHVVYDVTDEEVEREVERLMLNMGSFGCVVRITTERREPDTVLITVEQGLEIDD